MWTAAIFFMLLAPALRAAGPSGTLPVLHINTEGSAPIVSKEDYLMATYWLDPMSSDFEAVGSETDPLTTQIKGRGNYTWLGFDKKPYRLKLDKKTGLLGMKKSKHFGLLAHADDNTGFMRNIAGLELSRRLGLAWTPSAEAVEVVLNGEYIGLYFLTELVRVDPDRVNIVEQADNITDPEAITGGWLVEIDNYDTDPHVSITEGNGERIIFTYKTPEILSSEQENYLRDQMTAINAAIYTSDKTSSQWEQYVDIDALARYYIVQEIMDDCESFHGSCYLHRDLGSDKKWIFGPVWDFGNAMQRGTSQFIWDRPTFNQTWIGEIYKFPRFQEKVREIWAEFCNEGYTGFHSYLKSTAESLKDAAASDRDRWPNYGTSDEIAASNNFAAKIQSKIDWLGSRWGATPPPDFSEYTIYFRGFDNKWNLDMPLTLKSDGTYVLENISITQDFKLASEDWKTIDLGSNGEPLELNKLYQLKDVGGNISLKDNAPMHGVYLTFYPKNKTLLVSDKQGVSGITGDTSHRWVINGLSIEATEHIDVYTTTGALVASGRGHISLPGAGFYIVVENNSVSKIAAR